MTPMPPTSILFFLVTALIGLFLFSKMAHDSKIGRIVSTLWALLQSAIALTGFYLVTTSLPPRLLLAIAPPLVAIATLFLTAGGRRFLDAMDLKWSVLLHSIRILVELNLYWLFLYKQVPRLMAFEGGNVDIVIGLSAPFIWWAFSKKHIGTTGLLFWNSVALLSVLNALTRAMLSAPFPLQRLAFDQPTVAILTFPFVLLPALLVPIVVLSHLVIFRKLLLSNPPAQ
jgi:hypothetical protein